MAGPLAGLSIQQALAYQRRLVEVSDSAGLDAALLLCAVLAKPKSYLYAWPERTLTAGEVALYFDFLGRRASGEPVAHIIGQREFWSLNLKVSPASLIPRPDTECLVEQALHFAQSRRAGKILDLGTGSGAIALALASELPQWSVVGCDYVTEAVALAEENRQKLGLANVKFMQSNWYANLTVGDKYDLIVSNPPYIEENDPHLSQGDVRFEPRSALVSGEDGLRDIRRIVAESGAYLNSGGAMLLEHGYRQGDAVRQILLSAGFLSVSTLKDLAGQDRVSWGVKADG